MSKNPLDVLHKGLEELLNPISEQESIVGHVSEEGIFKSVQDIVEAEQMMEVNGGDNIDEEMRKLSR